MNLASVGNGGLSQNKSIPGGVIRAQYLVTETPTAGGQIAMVNSARTQRRTRVLIYLKVAQNYAVLIQSVCQAGSSTLQSALVLATHVLSPPTDSPIAGGGMVLASWGALLPRTGTLEGWVFRRLSPCLAGSPCHAGRNCTVACRGSELTRFHSHAISRERISA